MFCVKLLTSLVSSRVRVLHYPVWVYFAVHYRLHNDLLYMIF